MKKHRIVLILALSILLCSVTVRADSTNLETMDISSSYSILRAIGSSIINSNVQSLDLYRAYFTTSGYESVYNFINRNSIICNGSNIMDSSLEFTYPINSSTGDDVVMINYKLMLDSEMHNILYLFEFHINADGKIYGFNAWEY